MVSQERAAKPNVQEADVVMMASPQMSITVGVEELRKRYDKDFEHCLFKNGIDWRDNMDLVQKELKAYCNDESYKIEMVSFLAQ